MTRSTQKDSAGIRDVSLAMEAGPVMVSSVKDADPSTYREAIQSVNESNWEAAMQERI